MLTNGTLVHVLSPAATVLNALKITCSVRHRHRRPSQILQTAVSALHMLRYNAQDFSFHVIPTSIAQRRTTGEQGHHHFERGGRSVRVPTELPDGCGSLVFVNNRTPSDRSLVFLIRPPWLIGTDELKDFVKAAVRA